MKADLVLCEILQIQTCIIKRILFSLLFMTLEQKLYQPFKADMSTP